MNISAMPKVAVVIAALYLSAVNVAAQSDSSATPSAVEDMKPNTLYYLRGDALVKVDESAVDVGAGTSASGVGAAMLGFGSGVKTWMILPGESSELKIVEAQPRFRIAIEHSMATRLRLANFEVVKDKRRVRTESMHVLEIFKPAVPIDMTKTAEGVYEFTPKKPLKPGEYGFAMSSGGPVADFTIVAAGDKKHN